MVGYWVCGCLSVQVVVDVDQYPPIDPPFMQTGQDKTTHCLAMRSNRLYSETHLYADLYHLRRVKKVAEHLQGPLYILLVDLGSTVY